MSAQVSVSPEKVSIKILNRLSYDCWMDLRHARVEALERHLPLLLDINGCSGADLGGLGAVLIAQQQLGKIAIHGCSPDFARWFRSIGVCGRCQREGQSAGCDLLATGAATEN